MALPWSAAFPSDRELLVLPGESAPSSLSIEQVGAGGHRPSESKVEAKDIVKFYGEGAAFGARIALPKGMVIGGGASDMAMRGDMKAANEAVKVLAWGSDSGDITMDEKNSLLRYKVFPLGPLARQQGGNGTNEQKTGDSPASGLGIPIDIAAIRRARGAYTIRCEQLVRWDAPAGGFTFNLGASFYLNDLKSNATGWGQGTVVLQFSGKSAGSASLTSGVARIVTNLNCRPWATGTYSGPGKALSADDLAFNLDVRVESGAPASGSLSGTPVDFSSNVVVSALTAAADNIALYQFSLATKPADRTLWFDLAAAINGTANGGGYGLTLLTSTVTTLSGHDGLPFDWQQREVIEQ